MSEWISLEKAGQLLDPPVSRSTIFRWAKEGRNGVKLKTRRDAFTHGRVTTAVYLAEFLRERAAAESQRVRVEG